MIQLKSWRFKVDSGPTPRRIKLVTNQLYFFPLENHIYSLSLDNTDRTIEAALQKVGSDYNGIGTCFTNDLDLDDEPLPEGYLEVYNNHIKEDILVEITTYYKILLDYCHQLKEANKDALGEGQLTKLESNIKSLEKYVKASNLGFCFPRTWEIFSNDTLKLFDGEERFFLDYNFNFELKESLSIQLRHYDFIGLGELRDLIDATVFDEIIRSSGFKLNNILNSFKGTNDQSVYYFNYLYTVDEQYLIVVSFGEKQPTRFQFYIESIWKSIA